MPRKKRIARELVKINSEIENGTQDVLLNTIELNASKLALSLHLREASKLTTEYDVASDNTPDDTSSSHPIRQSGWLTRQIEKRVEKKYRRALEAEISRLIQIRQDTFPESNEKDLAYIRESMEKLHAELSSKLSFKVDHCKNHIAYSMLGAGVTALLAIPIGILTAGIALIYLLPSLFIYAGFGVYGAYKLSQIPKDYHNMLVASLEPVEAFAKSTATFDDILNENITHAKKLLNILTRSNNNSIDRDESPASQVSPIQHRIRHRHEQKATVSRHSIFHSKTSDSTPISNTLENNVNILSRSH